MNSIISIFQLFLCIGYISISSQVPHSNMEENGYPREHWHSPDDPNKIVYHPRSDISDHDDFCYHDCELTPEFWSDQWKSCKGNRQSPIDLKCDLENNLMNEDTLLDLSMLQDSISTAPVLPLVNTGHSLKASFEYQQDFQWSLKSNLMEDHYVASQLHLHMGYSEHSIEGKKYPLELHIVLFNEKYQSLPNAMDKEDGLIVIAKMFQYANFSDLVSPLDEVFEKAAEYDNMLLHKGGKSSIKFINLRSFFEPNDSYFIYDGSLTTPPCFESVKWVVNAQPGIISEAKVFGLFDTLKAMNSPLLNNWRPLQEKNDRKIFCANKIVD